MFGGSIRELLAFPFQRLSLETSLPVAEVLKRMEDAVEPRRLLRFSALHRDFEGVVSRTRFTIVRIIRYRNSFLPIITGTIQPRAEGGTRIELTMRMHWLVAAFMILWAGVPVAILAASLLHLNFPAGASTTPRESGGALVGIAAVMLSFGYGLCSVGFNIEARRARDLLIKIVGAGIR